MSRYYYLGPWVNNFGGWEAPPNTVGLVDLRGSSTGVGFFSTDVPLVNSEYSYFGSDLNGVMSLEQKNTWSETIGIVVPLGDYSLLDLLWLTLTEWADPLGITNAPPILPTLSGGLELHLGGHSLVRARQFTGSKDPAWPTIQARIHRDMRQLWSETQDRIVTLQDASESKLGQYASKTGITESQAREELLEVEYHLPRKVLGGLVLEYAPKGIDWSELVPSDVPLDGYEDPTTTYTDNFNRTENPIQAPWTILSGSFRLNNNVLNPLTVMDFGSPGSGRYKNPLSTSHQFSSITMTAQPGTLSSVSGAVRYSATQITYYAGILRSGTPHNALYKVVNGTYTAIASLAGVEHIQPFDTGVRASGSTITLFKAGADILTATDTTITGNLYAGFAMRCASTSERADNWYAEDVAGPGSAQAAMRLMRLMQNY